MSIIDLQSEEYLFHHGASVSAAPVIVNKYRLKVQRKTSYNRIIDRQVFLDARASFYKRKDLHHALIIETGPGFRITLPEGMFFDFKGDLGYMRTILAGEHFTAGSDGVTERRALGSNLFIIDVAAGTGWDFYKSNEYPLFLYTSIGLMTYFPNNGSWVYQPVFRAGLGFVLTRINETY